MAGFRCLAWWPPLLPKPSYGARLLVRWSVLGCYPRMQLRSSAGQSTGSNTARGCGGVARMTCLPRLNGDLLTTSRSQLTGGMASSSSPYQYPVLQYLCDSSEFEQKRTPTPRYSSEELRHAERAKVHMHLLSLMRDDSNPLLHLALILQQPHFYGA